jgi:tripartite-type tricarboxylate transporter receptor subunit TctC
MTFDLSLEAAVLRCSYIIAIAGLFVATTGYSANAQDWPKRPVTMIVPFAAGSSIDVVGRILAARLSESLGQPVIVENISGAGGMTGSVRVAKAAPDGYQVLMGSQSTHVINQLLYKKPLYDGAADFAPVALVIGNSKFLATRKDFPAGTLSEFIKYTKANQAKLQYGSGGIGSGPHITCLMLNRAIGVETTHVPYRGSGQAMQDLIAGRIDYSCDFPSIGASLVQNHSIKAIATLSPHRNHLLPDLPTADEQGLKGFDADAWNALFLPKGAPAPIVQRLARATGEILDLPEVRARLESLGYDVPSRERRTPDYLVALIRADFDKWTSVIKSVSVD